MEHSAELAVDTWYFIAMRFVPGYVDMLIGNAVIPGTLDKEGTGAAIPASLWQSSEPFRIANVFALYANIGLGSLWLAAEAVSDETLEAILAAQAPLFVGD